MAYIPLYELLPELAEEETCSINVQGNSFGFPPGEYVLMEMYCNDKECDCRRVILNVVTPHNMEGVASIGFGWEGEEYYRKWMKMGAYKELSEEELYMIEDFKGPSLNPLGEQSVHALNILELIKHHTLKEEGYVDRIKEHYKLFRKKVNEIHNTEVSLKKTGRNAQCPCGSGKKYKRCCIGSDVIVGEKPSDYKRDTVSSDFLDVNVEDEFEEDVEQEMMFELQDVFQQMLTDLRMGALKKKPHIREYQKARKLHSEIVSSMMEYHYRGKFEQKIETENILPEGEVIQNLSTGKFKFIEGEFDMDKGVDFRAFQDMLTYKTARNMNSITEEYIAKNKYRREDKKEFLQSMLKSRLGLFKVVNVDEREGYVFLEDVFTGEEVKIIDIALSGGRNTGDKYLYTRVITYCGFSFGSGLNFAFNKTDAFIKKFIKQERRSYCEDDELRRFMLLYNQYSKGESSVITKPNMVK